MEMTPRERLRAAILGQEVDHVPFSPFLAYYFDFLPEAERSKGDFQYVKEIGADPLLRGQTCAHTVRHRECTESCKNDGKKRYHTYHTPKGDLYAEYTYAPNAATWFITKYPITDAEQIPAAIAWFEDMEVGENPGPVNEVIRNIGEDGLMVGITGVNGKSAYQHLIEAGVGTENLAYLTADDPDSLEELLDVIARKDREAVEIAAKTDLEFVLSWEDSSTTNTSPAFYNQYIRPQIASWCDILEASGKHYIQHACGHIHDLLKPMAEEGIVAVESISPPPTGNVTVEEAFSILPDSVSIIGGIEPTVLLNSPTEEILEYVEHIVSVRGRHGLVVGNSDSCPPGVEYEKFVRIAELVKHLK